MSKKIPDLSRFTLPSSNEDDLVKMAKTSSLTVNPETIESSNEELFWAKRVGKVWIIGFFCLILVALVSSYIILRLGTQNETRRNSKVALPSFSPTVSSSSSPEQK